MPGLPGTGLGGVFYALLIVWMAVREAWLAPRRGTTPHRVKLIASLSAMLGAILFALWAEGWLIRTAVETWRTASPPEALAESGPWGVPAEQVLTQALVPAVVITPVIILLLMLAILQVARAVVPKPAPESSRTPSAPLPHLPSRKTGPALHPEPAELALEAAE